MKNLFHYFVSLLFILNYGCSANLNDCDTHPGAYNVSLNSITALNCIDNSDFRFNQISTTIPREAVAFQIILRDTAFSYENAEPIIEAIYECKIGNRMYTVDYFGSEMYIKPLLKSFKIVSLFNFNDSIKAGDEITDYVLCFGYFKLEEMNQEYANLKTVVDYYNEYPYYSYGDAKLQLNMALQKVCSADSLKLEFTIEFADETTLCCESETIYLID